MVIAWRGGDKLLHASRKENVVGRMKDRSRSFSARNHKRLIEDCSLSRNVQLKSSNKDLSLKDKLHAFIPLVFFLIGLPVGVEAQTASLAAPAPAQPAAYGSGVQTPLRYAGEAVPGNQVSLSMAASTFYDDNVLQTNKLRLSDEAASFGSSLALSKQTENVVLNFDYVPYFLLYRQVDQMDRLNHTANLNLTYRLSPHFNLELYDTISYQNGAYPSLTGQQIMSGLGSPTALNETIIPYTIRTLSNSSGLNLTYVKNRRTSLTLAGGYGQQRFGSRVIAGQSLYNTRGLSGGFNYQYVVTEHTTLGLLIMHQDSTFRGGEALGNSLRFQSESAFISAGSRLSPTVTVTIFGGPQYVRTIGQSAVTVAGQFQPSGGGSITKEVRDTALDLSVQRSVSSSGGLYALVQFTTASLGVKRRLVGRWEANWRGGAARADNSLFQFASGRTDAVSGLFGLDRALSRGSVFRISYATNHQLSKGKLPISAGFDRNRVTAGIDFQLKAIPLGR
jgi:hypothetical protein